MGYAVLTLIVFGLIVAAVVFSRSTPNKRAANTNHQLMARELDHLLVDDNVRPLLPKRSHEAIAFLLDEYYGEKVHTARLKELTK